MSFARRNRWLSLIAALLMIVAACGGSDDSDDNAEDSTPSETSAGSNEASGGSGPNVEGIDIQVGDCAVDALDDAGDVVELTMWHALAAQSKTALEQQAERYNASQDKVHLTVIEQGSYDQLQDKIRASLGSDELPALAIAEDTTTQFFIDTRSALPVQACVDAAQYDTSDLLPPWIDHYTVNDVLMALPFASSTPVLYYNKNAFRAAGLDPEKPPTSFAELREADAAIVESGAAKYGLSLKLDSWLVEHLVRRADELLVNHDNGRSARADELLVDTPLVADIWTWLQDEVDNGGLIAVEDKSGQFDHFVAVANGNAAMIIETSAAIATVRALTAGNSVDPGTSGLDTEDVDLSKLDIAVAPMPSFTDLVGSSQAGGGGAFIMANASPEEQAAAWDFLEFAMTPEEQATWHVESSYMPNNVLAVDELAVKELWAADPAFAAAYETFENVDPAKARGPLIGPYQAIRDAIEDGMDAVVLSGQSTADGQDISTEKGNKVLADWNERAG